MNKRRIVIADDHTIVREGIRSLLEAREDFIVVGEASTGREAIREVEELHPDIVIMDVSMPDLNGLEATRQIKKRFPDCKILVLTMYEDKESIRQMLQCGASGYVVKKSAVSQLFDAIEAVLKGEAFFSPSISKIVLEDYIKELDTSDRILSSREIEVLQLVAEGRTNKEIADLLHLSVKTVEGHKDNIKKKLNIRDTAGIVKYAIREKIIRLA
ncbi:MAG: response regulator transcription factor [Deltaproteobacteria bacterium]|nr:response regulator transcription factor [Deltaproteobacteria bacterium]